MKIYTQILYFLLMAFVVISCEDADDGEDDAIDLNAVKTELQTMEDAYAAGENSKDVEAIVAYYAEDAKSLPNNEPVVSGKNAIRARLKSELAKDTTENTIRFEVVDLWASGNLAVEVGRSITTDASGKEVNTGKYISVFEKRDGKYVCVRDIWNSDAPEE